MVEKYKLVEKQKTAAEEQKESQQDQDFFLCDEDIPKKEKHTKSKMKDLATVMQR